MSAGSAGRGTDLGRRLAWLLVFRGVVASILLALTTLSHVLGWQGDEGAQQLYLVIVVTYLAVFILGVALQRGQNPLALVAAYLASSVLSAFMVVQITGAVETNLSFLYLLSILDGAIAGGRGVALLMASACTLIFGSQLVGSLYGLGGGAVRAGEEAIFARAFVTHLMSFYTMALLAGKLAQQLQAARSESSTARRSLEAVERLHEAVLEVLPVGVVTVTAEGVVLTANATAERIVGRARGWLVGRPLPAPFSAMLARIEQETEVSGEGPSRIVAASTASLPVPAGEAVTVMVLEDRTDMRALEKDLAAKQRLASLGKVAAAIAHELRNPLAAISGAVELGRTDPSSRAALDEVVLREIERLNKLLSEFLQYARPTPAQRQPVDVALLVRDVCAMASHDPRCRGHALEVEAPARLQANLDPGQLRQVIWNLVRNAVEASPPGVPVVVRVTGGDPSSAVRLEVLDRGGGVSEALRAHLFEPFQSTKADGTGLGLAVVHRIVEAHGGTVDLVPRPGGGTAAVVALPDDGGLVVAPPRQG